eukprot:TRINITY_DN17528_c0_g1_i1.p1 TRINITY_DN17528_c0_g1~~TRINITY_DN17528_c0_g1_i1.p1  ORF type:complete len:147 (-),score=1.11 TRINITY_DN17528_c0_g1_i1:37-477(-)
MQIIQITTLCCMCLIAISAAYAPSGYYNLCNYCRQKNCLGPSFCTQYPYEQCNPTRLNPCDPTNNTIEAYHIAVVEEPNTVTFHFFNAEDSRCNGESIGRAIEVCNQCTVGSVRYQCGNNFPNDASSSIASPFLMASCIVTAFLLK